MVRILIVVAGGFMLFLAGLVGTLGFRGKLNAESFGEMFGGDHTPSEEHLDDQAKEQATVVATDSIERARPPSVAAASIAGPMDGLSISAPFSDEETRELFHELRSARGDMIEGQAALSRERRDLELVRMDLNLRWDEVEQKEQEQAEYAKSLVAQVEELESRAVLFKEAEADNLQQLAKDVEKMSADSAAKMLEQSEPDRVALILHFVKPRETGKILGAMPQEFAAEVANKMLGILKPKNEKTGDK